MSKIYLVERTDDRIIYDAYRGFVVVATSAWQARHLAESRAADEGKQCWRDPKQSKVTELGEPKDHTQRIILEDFNAG